MMSSDSRNSNRPVSDLKQSVCKEDITNIIAMTRKLTQPSHLIMTKRQHATIDEMKSLEAGQSATIEHAKNCDSKQSLSLNPKNLRSSKKEISLRDKLLAHV